MQREITITLSLEEAAAFEAIWEHISGSILQPGKVSSFTAMHQKIGGKINAAKKAAQVGNQVEMARGIAQKAEIDEQASIHAASEAAHGDAPGSTISGQPMPTYGPDFNSTPNS